MKNQQLDVLASVMQQRDQEIINTIGFHNGIVVNQTDSDEILAIKSTHENITWINSSSRGLSKSRNLALSSSSADICLLVDDDEVLDPDYEEKIVRSFNNHPNADVIAFIVRGVGREWKTYSKKPMVLNLITSMRVSSVQIAFKRRKIIECGINFDEDFGAGSGKYIMGEENIFLADCLKKQLRLLYLPIEIAKIDTECESSWFIGYNRTYFISKGAQFYRMCPSLFHWLLIIQFLIRKRRLYIDETTMNNALGWMIEGARQCAMQNASRPNNKWKRVQ